MESEKRILVWSDDEKTMQMVDKVAKELSLELMIADVSSDLIACSYCVGIADGKKLTADEMGSIEEMLEMQNPDEFVLFLISYAFTIPKSIRKHVINLEAEITAEFLNKPYLKNKMKSSGEKILFRPIIIVFIGLAIYLAS